MPNKPPLDETARRFLGVQSPDEVQTIPGQTADPKRLRKNLERHLISDACAFADDLVGYIAAHREVSPAQQVWACALSLFCTRADYPDGLEKFDDLADWGGKDLQLDVDNRVEEAYAQGIVAEVLPFGEEEFKAAAALAEAISKYVEMQKRSTNISNPQAAYALGRTFHNLRRTFPVEHGGRLAFDAYVREATHYFEQDQEEGT